MKGDRELANLRQKFYGMFVKLFWKEPDTEFLLSLLDGVSSAYRDSVIFNSAAALVISGRAKTLIEGAELAKQSIDSGSAKLKLEALVDFTNRDYNGSNNS